MPKSTLATTTIKAYFDKTVQTATPTVLISNVNSSTLELVKSGKTVMLRGILNLSSDTLGYQKIFNVPEGYRPYGPISITPYNGTEITWLFGDYAGDFSTQAKVLSAGLHYFTSTWLVG